MTESEAKRRAAAIEALAAELARLRESVGTPSFRVMAGRSGAISHTTLHEAAQGNRLPSWETTVEFVKACGGDPQDYRERWERSSREVEQSCAERPGPSPVGAGAHRSVVSAPIDRTHEAGHDEPGQDEAGQQAPGHRAADDDPTDDDVTADHAAGVHDPPREHRRRYVAIGAGSALVVLGAAVVLNLADDGKESPSSSPSSSTSALTPSAISARSAAPSAKADIAAHCPVKQTNPPWVPPRHDGDKAHFVTDVTMGDCDPVPRGKTVRKVWRFRNIGTVTWTGYSLHRIGPPARRDQCQTITNVPIKTTRPGETVDIATQVTTPSKPGYCLVRFKMTDGDGEVAYPGNRPVYFQVEVK